MRATQVPETIGYSIPHDTIVDAVREDGFLQKKLPEWQDDTPPPEKPPVVELKLELTNKTHIVFQARKHGVAYLIVMRNGHSLVPFTTIEARKAEVLPLLLADIEEALPVLRAIVRNMEEA